MDGEAGRFEFETHSVSDGGEIRYNSARDLFPESGNNEFYKTVGFKEIAMTYGDTDKSFRKTVFLLNRVRQQEGGGTSGRTLRENTVKEGAAVLGHMIEITAGTFSDAGFSEDGTWHGSEYAGIGPATLPAETVAEAVGKVKDRVEIGDVLNNPVCFEDPTESVNIAMDDVIVKKQKETREDIGDEEEQKRKYVHNTIARVENGGRSYALNGNDTLQVLLFITALILRSGLIGLRFQFFTDGHTVLNQSILRHFCWSGNKGIILDWYHLGKKCKEKLSLAMKGRVLRNEILRQIMPLLWFGKTDGTFSLLTNFDSSAIKNSEALKNLVGYLVKNRPYIPVYAIRKQLGLCNSSSIGEKMNDLLVSNRQKRNGMSWSKQGSASLASITALRRNNESRRWFEKKELDFVLPAAA